MITYAYWFLGFVAAFALVYLVGARMSNWKVAFFAAAFVLFVWWAMYFFYFQQIFVKRWGGVMEIRVPAGHRHITSTWKDDNLWIENYDPATNRCIFTEYSRGNVLEGKVIINDCNPLGRGYPDSLPSTPPVPVE